MLSQVNRCVEFAGAGVDVILLLRVLTLKLHKAYLFITLACVLTVFFDVVDLWLPPDSVPLQRVYVYSSFLFALVFPIAAWDVFEELSSALKNLRRVAITRTVLSLVMITFFGLLLAGLEDTNDNSLAFAGTLAFIVLTGSTTGSLAFVWAMHRAARAQKLETPHNTHVWVIFYELFLAGQVVTLFFSAIRLPFPKADSAAISQGLELTLNVFLIVITWWCTVKLRALPKDLPPTPVKENF